ncbi:MAG: hypothetical protein QOJ43_2625 [Gaiellaceae bacterium]|nr:hypothetical protein [Gaiellaceae bacterium]
MAQSYEVVTVNRAGIERGHPFVSQEPIAPGTVLRLAGRDWLIERVEEPDDGQPARAIARPARYRLSLRHPDGREDVGAFRRYRPDGPRLGHAFSTIEGGHPISWEVADERLDRDEDGNPFLALVAERDYGEREGTLPDHELEHALMRRGAELPEAAAATVQRARDSGLAIELVALDPGEAPDWEEAQRYIEAISLETVEDDLLEQCGVDPDRDPRDTWLDRVKGRLRDDLERFRADVEDDRDEIEVWDFQDGRIFASVGGPDDESDPKSAHGWLTRLVDAGALGAAGFSRVRKAELLIEEG